MSLFTQLSYKSRRQKLQLFYDTIRPDKNTRILDVGAEINPAGNRGLQLIDGYQWKSNISAINLSESHIDKIKQVYPEIDARVGNACELSYPDNSFDVVYSNAVIEHVGSFETQKQMAAEIMRVGKSWFVTTPNRWYPFEFHMRLPFVTWLPFHGYRWASMILAYNHVKRRHVFGSGKRNIRLMSASECQACFPGSKIIRSRITFMAETLIVYGDRSRGSVAAR